MRRRVVFWTAVACAALVAPWVARAQGRASQAFAPDAAKTASRSSPEVREERNLLRASATSSLLATRAATLAVTKSPSAEVRSFAAGLLRHHEGAQLELLRLLQARGMAMPMLDNAQSTLLRRLEKLSGKGFDREFMQGLGPETLRKELRSLETAAQTVKDPMVKAWAERSLPGLREQLLVAERTERTGGATRTAGARNPAGAAAQDAAVTPVGTRVNGSNSR